MHSLSVPQELTTLEREAIVTHLKSLKDTKAGLEARRSFDFSLPGRPPLFIKQDSDIFIEAETQHFFHLLAQGDKSAPRVPKVFDAFSSRQGRLMVMEKMVAAPTLSDCDISEEQAVEYAASAVKWLLDQSVSLPEGAFGRITSKTVPACHRFFKEHEAPRAFANPDELAEYVRKASRRRPMGAWLSASDLEKLTSFAEDSRCIFHSDIKKENFLLDSNNNVCIIDFQHIGVLPRVFQTYAFFNIGWPFAASVGRKLGYQPSSAANEMSKISGLLWQTGGNASLRGKW